MNNLPELTRPFLFFLSLLPGLAAVVLSLWYTRGPSGLKKTVAGVLRTLVVLALSFYLGGPRWTVSEPDQGETDVLLDTSYSISDSTWKQTLEDVVRAKEQFRKKESASLFLFGGLYERLFRYEDERWSGTLDGGRSALDKPLLKRINPYRSNIRATLGDVRASSAGRDDGRTVLLTDGYSVAEPDWTEEWKKGASDRDLVAIPVEGRTEQNTGIRRISAPARVRGGEPVTVEVTLYGTGPAEGRLTVRIGDALTERKSFRIRDGKPITIRIGPVSPFAGASPDKKRLVDVEARIQVEGDGLSIDNRARTGMVLYPPLRVLALSSRDQSSSIERAMDAQGLDVTRVSEPLNGDLRDRLPEVDLVLIEQPPAAWADERLEKPIRSYVRERRGGLLVISGSGSRTRSWFENTTLSSLFPVEPVPREEPAEPPEPDESEEPEQDQESESDGTKPDESGEGTVEKGEVSKVSLMLVIDTSGSMSEKKLDIVKEAAIATIETLDPEDRIGVVAFDHRRRWITRPITADRASTFKRRIAKLRAGGGTRIIPALRMAGNALRSEDAGIKHMILLSDGKGETGDYRSIVRSLREKGVTVSTVATGRQVQMVTMMNIADWGGGKMYEPTNFQEVPQIFTTEARAAVKASEEREKNGKRPDDRPPESLPSASKGDAGEDGEQDESGQEGEEEGKQQPEPSPPETEHPVRREDPAPFLQDLDTSNLPPVRRIFPTKSREFAFIPLVAEAKPDRPFMGYRYSGTGTAGVILSSMNQEDAPGWVDWEKFPAFVGQTARFLSRERTPELIHPEFEVRRETGSPEMTVEVSVPELKREDREAKTVDFDWRSGGETEWNETDAVRLAPGVFRVELVGSRPGAFAAFRLNVELENGREFTGFHTVPSSVPEEFGSTGINQSFFNDLEAEGISVKEDIEEVFRESSRSRRSEKRPVPRWPLAFLSVVIVADIYLIKSD